MIKGKWDFRRKKLSLEEKALKKVLRPLAKEIAARMKGDVPKLTGALRISISSKIISKKGKAAAIIGVRNTYSKKVKGKVKIPNLYARKINKRTGFLQRGNLKQYEARLVTAAAAEVQAMIRGAA